MVVLLSIMILVSITVVLLIMAWKVLNWVWITPKKIEKTLRSKGFKGNSYRLLIGDLKDHAKLVEDAKLKPINFTHDIIPRVLPHIRNLVHDCGKKSFYWMGPDAYALVFEPDQIKEILAKSYVYRRSSPNPFTRFIGGGLSSYDKDKWAKHRKLITPAFSLEKLKRMIPAFYLSCSEMLNTWDMLASSAERGCLELDVRPYLNTLTSDVISRTAFGSNYEEGKRIFELQKQLTELIIQNLGLLLIPGILYLPIKRFRRMKAMAKEVHTSILRIVNGRMKAIREQGSRSDDLLGVLLESNLNEIHEQGSNKSGMSFDEVVEECKLFYFAGQETSATLLVWTLILLSKHSDWQDRARDEIRQVFGGNKPDYEGLNKLKVITMIIYEVLRLYPVAVMATRTIYEDTTLGDQTLPAGTRLYMPTIFLHHDENIWGEDAKEFKPERFSEGVAKATKGQHVYFPFSSGPRVCIGQNFAMLEAKMALSLILKSYSFEISPLYAHAPYAVISLQPQHGAQLILHKL